MIGLDTIATCAPQVAPHTVAAIIQVESGGNPLAIHINGPIRLPKKPLNDADAAQLARSLIKAGYSVDLGLMQINSRNLPGLGLSVEQVFDPCTNIRAGARILTRGYLGASKHFGPGQNALKAAISAYNTGNFEAGFRNGYVAKVYGTRPNIRAVLRWTTDSPHTVSTQKVIDPYSANSTVYINPTQPRRSADDPSTNPPHLAPNPFSEPS